MFSFNDLRLPTLFAKMVATYVLKMKLVNSYVLPRGGFYELTKLEKLAPTTN